MKNAFLHGDFQEEVYTELPLGCNMQSKDEKHVYRLKIWSEAISKNMFWKVYLVVNLV
jgi:hypothetical protein